MVEVIQAFGLIVAVVWIFCRYPFCHPVAAFIWSADLRETVRTGWHPCPGGLEMSPPSAFPRVLLDAAEEHGRESEPDHEVGDLQIFLLVLWALLTPAQKRAFAANPFVYSTLEGAVGDARAGTLLQQLRRESSP